MYNSDRSEFKKPISNYDVQSYPRKTPTTELDKIQYNPLDPYKYNKLGDSRLANLPNYSQTSQSQLFSQSKMSGAERYPSSHGSYNYHQNSTQANPQISKANHLNIQSSSGKNNSEGTNSSYSYSFSSNNSSIEKNNERAKINLIMGSEKSNKIILKGLENLGNTCYMNSVLQCLFYLPKFSDYFLSGKYKIDLVPKHSEIVTYFADLILKMRKEPASNEECYENPSQFKNRFNRICPKFRGNYEEDAQEFFISLFEIFNNDLNVVLKPVPYKELEYKQNKSLEENSKDWLSYNLSREKSIITDLFMGQVLELISCKGCKREERSFGQFWSLFLNFPAKTRIYSSETYDLSRLIQLNEIQEEIPDLKCEKCKVAGKSYKSTYYFRMPEILCIVIKRFKMTSLGKEKNDAIVDIPLYLDSVNHNYQYTRFPRYELISVVSHYGTLSTGHYICDCKHPENGKWYRFNDDKVTESKLFVTGNRTQSSNAYLLFYFKRQNLSPRLQLRCSSIIAHYQI